MAFARIRLRSTGWRDITDLLLFGWTAQYVHIRRDGEDVILRVFGLDGRESTNRNFLELPEGFAEPRSYTPVVIGGEVRPGRIDASRLLNAGAALQSATPVLDYHEISAWRVPGLAMPSTIPGSEVA